MAEGLLCDLGEIGMFFYRIGGAECADAVQLNARSVATHGENPHGSHPLRNSSGDGIAIGRVVGGKIGGITIVT